MKNPIIKFVLFLFIPLCILQAGIIFYSIKTNTNISTQKETFKGVELPIGSSTPTEQLEIQPSQEEIKKENKEDSMGKPSDVIEPTHDIAINFLFFGDMMLDRTVGTRIKENGLDHLFEKLAGEEKKFFQGIDIISCNLEGAVTDNGAHYTPQVAYDFAFHPDLINQLKDYNFNFFNISNNHLYDQGRRGVDETQKNLDEMNFNYSGCIDGVIDKCSSTILNISDKKIAMAGFSAVYSKLDKEKLKTEIQNLADKSDFVIVNMHWGIEYTNHFNKTQQELAHILIDSGADIIIGHHPHVVQGIEIYNNKPIFYSLGNFIFDQYFSKETQEGLAVGINLEDENLSIFLYPFKSKLSQVELMVEKEKEEFLENLVEWSEVGEEYVGEIKEGRIGLKF